MGSKIAKEIFIIVLLLIVVLFTIGILFYEFIPSKNENISSSKYTPTDKVVATTPKIGTRISFGGIVSFIMSNRFGLKRKVAPNPITFKIW